MIVIAIAALPCAYVQHLHNRERIEGDSIEQLCEVGGAANVTITLDSVVPDPFDWFGSDKPFYVRRLALSSNAFTDEDLDTVAKLERLERLTLFGCDISDAARERLPNIELDVVAATPSHTFSRTDPLGGHSGDDPFGGNTSHDQVR